MSYGRYWWVQPGHRSLPAKLYGHGWIICMQLQHWLSPWIWWIHLWWYVYTTTTSHIIIIGSWVPQPDSSIFSASTSWSLLSCLLTSQHHILCSAQVVVPPWPLSINPKHWQIASIRLVSQSLYMQMMMNALLEPTCVSIHVRTLLAATHVTAILAMSWVEMAAHAMVQ